VEVRALQTNTTVVIVNFLYDHILTWFGCLLIIVIDQGTHSINDVICYLTNHFILKHTNFTIFYLESTIHPIIHKGMDKLSLLRKFLVHYSWN
jgi:hypothetical protein